MLFVPLYNFGRFKIRRCSIWTAGQVIQVKALETHHTQFAYNLLHLRTADIVSCCVAIKMKVKNIWQENMPIY